MGDSSTEIPRDTAPKNYALSGKIMLSAIIILFTVVVLIVCLHMYARWFLIRARRRHHNHRRTRRRTRFIFSSTDPTTTVIAPSRGLDATILKSLPMFIYSSNTHEEALECAVCLSEFEENEKGRVLPKCNHSFHIDCIDMWFHSHTTCPLCRSHVQPETLVPAPAMEHQVSILISHGEYAESEAEPSSGLCSSCRHHENQMGSSSSSSTSTSTSMVPLGSRRKPLELSVEVFRRNDSFRNLEEEVGLGSPSGQGFKSPGSRLRSLRRILSRDRKAVVSSSPSSSSSATALSSNSATETDLERGEEPKTQP